MILFIRAYYGLIGLIGHMVYFFHIRIREKIVRERIFLLPEEAQDDEWAKIDNIRYFGLDEDTYYEITSEAVEYRNEKVAKVKAMINLADRDQVDLNRFYFTMKHIQVLKRYRRLKPPR